MAVSFNFASKRRCLMLQTLAVTLFLLTLSAHSLARKVKTISIIDHPEYSITSDECRSHIYSYSTRKAIAYINEVFEDDKQLWDEEWGKIMDYRGEMESGSINYQSSMISRYPLPDPDILLSQRAHSVELNQFSAAKRFLDKNGLSDSRIGLGDLTPQLINFYIATLRTCKHWAIEEGSGFFGDKDLLKTTKTSLSEENLVYFGNLIDRLKEHQKVKHDNVDELTALRQSYMKKEQEKREKLYGPVVFLREGNDPSVPESLWRRLRWPTFNLFGESCTFLSQYKQDPKLMSKGDGRLTVITDYPSFQGIVMVDGRIIAQMNSRIRKKEHAFSKSKTNEIVAAITNGDKVTIGAIGRNAGYPNISSEIDSKGFSAGWSNYTSCNKNIL